MHLIVHLIVQLTNQMFVGRIQMQMFVDDFLFPLKLCCVSYVIDKEIMENNYYNVLTSTGE